MSILIDRADLSQSQRVEIYEDEGTTVWLIDAPRELKLEASAAMKLLEFLELHQDRLCRWQEGNERSQS